MAAFCSRSLATTTLCPSNSGPPLAAADACSVTLGFFLFAFLSYTRRTVNDDGIYEDIHRGITLGCPLPPLMGALYLKQLDERMGATGLFYARYMDDWVVLAPTRWRLRKAIKLVNETLAELEVEKHPDKTYIGRISRGFDFLGYTFSPAGGAYGSRRPPLDRQPVKWI